MRYLYLDNFRGFSDTLIPLKQVNFLVGENSTGKTSILALLHLLSHPMFWIEQLFNVPEYSFGGFQNIISAKSDNKKTFHIGYLETNEEKNSRPKILECYLMTFREQEGLPIIYRSSKVVENELIEVIVTKAFIRHKLSDWTKNNDYKLDAGLIFRRLKNKHDKKLSGSKQLSIPSSFLKTNVFSFFTRVEEQITKREKGQKKKSGLQVSFPVFSYDFVWLAPIRTKPKGIYGGLPVPFTPEGEHTPHLIKKQLKTKEAAQDFKSTLELFGRSSGLFKEVKIKSFGTETSAPFEIQIVLTDYALNINNVGYGVSQVLPLIVEIFSRFKESWFSVQQPEIHLHPKAQAALGDFIFKIASRESKYFLIETHSDYTIDRFRLNYKKRRVREIGSQVLFFERYKNGNIVHLVPISKRGEYINPPKSFRNFFIKEELKLLSL